MMYWCNWGCGGMVDATDLKLWASNH